MCECACACACVKYVGFRRLECAFELICDIGCFQVVDKMGFAY